jgi:hypothetical protein
VVALSKSPVFHREFSSVSKAIDALAKNEHEFKRVRKLFQEQLEDFADDFDYLILTLKTFNFL